MVGQFAFLPFGKEAVSRDLVTGKDDIGTGALGLVGNIVCFILAGVWLALGHAATALALFLTIVGIPFGVQHLKLAVLALAPAGKTIVPKQENAKTAGASAMWRCNPKGKPEAGSKS